MSNTHPTFTVDFKDTQALTEIPGDWTQPDYEHILRETEFGDFSGLNPTEIEEMALMSLADLDKNEAAELLMKYVFDDEALSKGQIQNASHEADTEKLWEEYPEPDKHRCFFRVGSLLYRAYNGGFPKPDARQVEVLVTPKKGGKALLENPTPAFVARLLAGGMDDHALLHRLYDDELKSEHFPAAENIIWEVKSTPDGAGGNSLVVLSSDYWLEVFGPGGAYECAAWADVEALENH